MHRLALGSAVALAVLAGLALLLVWGSGEATADSVKPTSVELDVSPNGTGSRIIVITLENNSTNQQTYKVTIDVGRLDASPAVYNETLNPGESKSREVTISAQLGSVPTQVEGRVEIRVTHVWGVPSPGGTTRRMGFNAIILQYALVKIEASASHQTITKGEKANLSFNLNNSGNNYDGFNLTLRGLPAEWSAEYLTNKGVMAPGEHITINVTIIAHQTKTVRLRLVAVSHFNTSVTARAEMTVEAEAAPSWLWPAGAAALGGGALAAVVVAAAVKRRRGKAGAAKEEW